MPTKADTDRREKGFARRFGLALLLFGCVMLVPALIGWGRAAVECRMLGGGAPARSGTGEAPAGAAAMQVTPPLSTYSRPEAQTYLTFPEWYIVYSADEYAAFLAHSPPSRFPYFQAVGQFWQAYYDVCAVTRDRYPFNSDTHLMLAVIGTSFTAENVCKGIYENTIGRVAEWTSSGEPTPEEVYAREVAAEYGTFLHTTPWYMFPFGAKLGALWETSLWGPNVVRKVERRLALSLEYGVKAGYGWLIRQATESIYTPEDLEIWAWAEGVTTDVIEREPRLRIVQATDRQAALVALPRYEAFTLIVPRLVGQGVRFTQVAGNDEIMVTVLAPRNWTWNRSDGELLFAMPILSQPERTRLAVRVSVGALHSVVGDLTRASASEAVTLEHIYDY